MQQEYAVGKLIDFIKSKKNTGQEKHKIIIK